MILAGQFRFLGTVAVAVAVPIGYTIHLPKAY